MEKSKLKDPSRILNRVTETLNKYQMLRKGDRVVAGVSGGPDSVALVRILKLLQEALSFDLSIAHLNHGLRGNAADADELFSKFMAEELGLPFYSKTEDVRTYSEINKLSLEHGARRIRYNFYHQIIKDFGYTKIALGHHADDNAEVVLMALLRGSGPLGLSGIPPVRDGRIIRPLIQLTKSEIVDFLKINSWPFRMDETNQEADFLRNRIRLHLIPLLEKEYNPKIVESLNRVSDILICENDSLEKWTAEHLPFIVSEEINENGERVIRFSISDLSGYHLSLRRRLMRGMIKKIKQDLKGITFDHVNEVLHLMEKGPIQGYLHLPDKILVQRKKDRMFLLKKSKSLRNFKPQIFFGPEKEFCYTVESCKTIEVKEIRTMISFSEIGREKLSDICSAGQGIAFFDIKKAKFPLILRNLNSQDRFVPLGVKGSQSVSKFLKDHKVAVDMRHQAPVLISGQKIAWVVGHRIDDRFKVTEDTRKILKVEIKKY